jgi:hypothetical protein
MKLLSRLFFAILVVICLSAPVFAQDDNPFLLKRGDNEFGFWAGFSPKATTIFEGLREDEAEDRTLFIAGLRYGRTLAANNSVALQYTIDVVPVAVATGTIVSRTFSPTGGEIFQRETAYGAGITPIGFQLDFANGSKVHPFAHVNGGFLYFNKSMPIEDSGQFQFVGEAGGGVRIFTSERRAVNIGVKFHHISNGNRSGANRGLNNFVIYAGFSIFR